MCCCRSGAKNKIVDKSSLIAGLGDCGPAGARGGPSAFSRRFHMTRRLLTVWKLLCSFEAVSADSLGWVGIDCFIVIIELYIIIQKRQDSSWVMSGALSLFA